MVLLWSLFACGEGDLAVQPVSLSWGEVDFQTSDCTDCTCENGCQPMTLTLTNAGDADLHVELPLGVDAHLCPFGYDGTFPIDLGTLSPDASFTLTFSVCYYEPGERDTLVEGTIDLETDGIDTVIRVPFSFTPIRIIGGGSDSGNDGD
jgi:hypothetical protein